MDVWRFISDKLNENIPVELLYVLQSEGSSPGRQGFKMAVAADGEFCGTIGGGIMEHKLVEMAKARLLQDDRSVLLMRQHHDKDHPANQSGMICSGSQLNAFIPVRLPDKKVIDTVLSSSHKYIRVSSAGLFIAGDDKTGLQYQSDTDWQYQEAIDRKPVIHIIGGGHVSLALSELMRFLGFYIHVYDDRPELSTLVGNVFADECHLADYAAISESLQATPGDYVVIMTIGYRTDKIVLRQLLNMPFAYLGMLGSARKTETLFAELKQEGVGQDLLERIHAPIGINIDSKTTREIAVSIAAEIIRYKNRDIPSGRATL